MVSADMTPAQQTGQPTFYLHVGMHKTGTTAIQRHFYGNADAFYRKGVAYFLTRDPNHSFFLMSQFMRGEGKIGRFAERNPRHRAYINRRDKFAADFRTFLKDAASHGLDAVVSGEEASGLPIGGVEDLRDVVTRHYKRVVVLALVRPPRSYIRSAVQQRIKGRETFEGLIQRPPTSRYKSRFAKFEEVFGAESVRYKVFHRSTLVNGCAFATLVSMMDGDRSALVGEPAARSNESVSMPSAKILSLLNEARQGAGWDGLPPWLGEALRGLPAREFGIDLPARPGNKDLERFRSLRSMLTNLAGEPFRLPRELAELAGDEVQADLDWMTARLGPSLLELDEPPPADPPTVADMKEFSDDEIAGIRAQLSDPKSAARKGRAG